MQKIFRGNKARRETEQMKKKLQNPLAPPPPKKLNLLGQITGLKLKKTEVQKEENKKFSKPKVTKKTVMDVAIDAMNSRRESIIGKNDNDNDADDESGWESDFPNKSKLKPQLNHHQEVKKKILNIQKL